MKKIQKLHFGLFSASCALLCVMAAYLMDAPRSAPYEAMQQNASSAIINPVKTNDQHLSEGIIEASTLGQPDILAIEPLSHPLFTGAEANITENQLAVIPVGSSSEAFAANDGKYAYTAGSQFNRPLHVKMETVSYALLPLTPAIPEASTYTMLCIGILGLVGACKWRRKVGHDDTQISGRS